MLQATRRATPEATNAGRGITPLDPTKREQKERGLFNFLTWPFLLAQMFAAEEFLSGGPRSTAADEERAKLANTGQNKGSGAEGDLPAASGSLRGANEDESSAVPETRLDPGDRGELRESRPLEPGPNEQWATYKQDGAAGGGGSGGGGGGGESDDQAPANPDNTGVGLPELASGTDSLDGGPLGSASALPLLNSAGALPLQTLASLDPGSVIQGALPIVDSVGPLLTTATEAASGAVADTLDGVTSVLAAVPQVVTGLVEPVSDISGNVSSVTDSVVPVLTATTAAATNLVTDTVDSATSVLAAVPQALTGLAEPVNDIAGNVVQTVSSVTDSVVPVLTATTTAATNLVTDTVDSATSVLAAVPPTLTGLVEPVDAMVGNAIQTVSSVAGGVAPVLAATSDGISNLVTDTISSAAPVLAAVPQMLMAATDAGGNVVQGLDASLDGVPATLTGATTGLDGLGGGALGSVTSLLEGGTSGLEAGGVTNLVTDLLQSVSPMVDNAGAALGAASGALGNVAAGIGGTATDLAQQVLSFGEAAGAASSAPESDPAIASAEIVIDPLSADLSVRSGGEAFASGGTIAFSSRTVRDDAADDPFANGTHTPYGLALTIDATEGARGVHQAIDLDQGVAPDRHADRGREHESSQDGGADSAPPGLEQVADLSNTLDDIGSRTGDLLL